MPEVKGGILQLTVCRGLSPELAGSKQGGMADRHCRGETVHGKQTGDIKAASSRSRPFSTPSRDTCFFSGATHSLNPSVG